ncbi:hypothetical protein TNCV_2985981 [Trichonephila clavipes]|nr:hypothetical protein TNCV_2985981 [Trichonephila clavipes]
MSFGNILDNSSKEFGLVDRPRGILSKTYMGHNWKISSCTNIKEIWIYSFGRVSLDVVCLPRMLKVGDSIPVGVDRFSGARMSCDYVACNRSFEYQFSFGPHVLIDAVVRRVFIESSALEQVVDIHPGSSRVGRPHQQPQ